MGKILSLFALASIVQLTLCANLKKDLDDFYNSFGASANVSSADVYQGQKAGYATGGSVTVRNRVLNSKIATVNLPKIDAGCGGIDIYAGGFSFINNEKLVENLKSIAASSVGYAFFLGVETVSPQIANQMKTLQSWANTINGMGINSCETAAQLVGSVWPKSEMASQHICRSIGAQQGFARDQIQARHQCGTPQAQADFVKDTQEMHPNLLYGDYNLAWMAIQQQSLLAGRTDLAELLMTITGTIISKNVNGERKFQFLQPQITNESFLKILLEGGTGKIYKCDNKKQCLNVREEVLTIPMEDSWIGKIQNMLVDVQNKIINDEELNSFELSFLASSSLPLYKIVNVLTAYKHGNCSIELINIADIVAMDMLMQCLKEGVEAIRAGSIKLREEQMYADRLDEYISNLDRVRKEIQYYEMRTMSKMEKELQLMKKVHTMEEQIAMDLGF